MYDLQYVKKRRRRKIAALVSLFTAIGITSLVIISFLGRTVGTFTVSLKNNDVKLSLSEKASFENPTSYLRLGKILGLRETSFVNLPEAEVIDSDETPYDYGTIMVNGKPDSLQYVKYTFFVRNVGKSIAQYNMSINITDRSKADNDERILDDTLRVMVYENNPNEDTHNYRVFAKASAENNIDKDGNETRREFISTVPELKVNEAYPHEDDEHPLAETFASGSTVAEYKVGNFGKDDVKRYTIVLWLEGDDPQSTNDRPVPEGATIKLGIDITAYENV